MNDVRYYQGTGRRKEAVARVKLFPGSGAITVNNKPVQEYFGTRQAIFTNMCKPLAMTNMLSSFDITIKVRGGGVNGQVEAARLGITRALMESDETLRPALKKAGLVTRDARVKERKKAGLKRARKRPQYTKR